VSLVSNLQTLATRIATETKSLRTLINGNGADLSSLTTTAKANLVAAVNELNAAISGLAGGGSATNLDALTDVVITSPTTGHLMRYNGSTWVNVAGATYFDAAGAASTAQAASQPLDSDLTAIAALTTASFGRSVLTAADAAALTAMLNTATTTLAGIVQLATTAETTAGVVTA
jgi:hypothetical protein